VCLDCGKQFEYDLAEMRIGKAIDHSHDAAVVPPRAPVPPATKVKYAVLAAVPVALIAGAIFKAKKPGAAQAADSGNPPSGPAGDRARRPDGR
jgi:hypothetical protein